MEKTDHNSLINSYKKHKDEYNYETHVYNRIIELLQPNSGTIIDFGSGFGHLTKHIAQNLHCEKVLGLDISSDLHKYAKKHFSSEKIEYILNNGTIDLLDTLATDSIDGIYSVFVICTMKKEELVPILKKVHRILKPGKKLLIMNANREEFKTKRSKGFELIHGKNHPHYENDEAIQVILHTGEDTECIVNDYYHDHEYLANILRESGFNNEVIVETPLVTENQYEGMLDEKDTPSLMLHIATKGEINTEEFKSLYGIEYKKVQSSSSYQINDHAKVLKV